MNGTAGILRKQEVPTSSGKRRAYTNRAISQPDLQHIFPKHVESSARVPLDKAGAS